MSRTEYGVKMGCYKDLPVRAMESLEGQDHVLDGNYKTRKDAIIKCRVVGLGRGYPVVGLQDGGMCVGSAKLRDFSKYGVSRDCKSDDKGGPWATEVQAVIGYIPDVLASVKYELLGCYKDKHERAIPSMENSDILLNDSYSQRNDPIQKCALAAKLRRYKTFAVQDGGMCVSGPRAHEVFDKYGESQDCKNDGKGGPWANQVYNLKGTLEDILSSSVHKYFRNKLGCFEDTQARTIPSLEGQDPVLDGNYTARRDGIRKCALAARRRGNQVFVVMADGQCASGPNTARNFVKFGYGGENECSKMKVRHNVYGFGYGEVDALLPFVEYEPVGCYKDLNSKRAIDSVDGGRHFNFIPDALIFYWDNHYKTRYQAIQKCAIFAKLQGYKMFAVQDGGQCLTSRTAHLTYNRYGESQDCKSDGKGGPWANQVYRLPERKVDHISIGCLKDHSWYPTLPSLEGQDPLLDGDYKLRENAIQKCAFIAKERGYKMFAIQDGKCLGSAAAPHKTFSRAGGTTQCKWDGRGRFMVNHFYVIGEMKDFYRAMSYDSLGCYKYSPEMTVLEGDDPDVLDGNYTLRKDAIDKCALAAMKMGYDVFAVHDGGKCLVSDTVSPTFNKYGISQDCKSDGKGGPGASSAYIIGVTRDLFASVKYKPLGCYRDKRERAIPSMERSDILLNDNYSQRSDAIQKCALAANRRRYKTFAVQDGGMCVSGPRAHKTFDKYGESQDCKNDGKGGPKANQVYNIIGPM